MRSWVMMCGNTSVYVLDNCILKLVMMAAIASKQWLQASHRSCPSSHPHNIPVATFAKSVKQQGRQSVGGGLRDSLPFTEHGL
jgi:hypothetical protein